MGPGGNYALIYNACFRIWFLELRSNENLGLNVSVEPTSPRLVAVFKAQPSGGMLNSSFID